MVKIKVENEKQKSVANDYVRLFETNSFGINYGELTINGKISVPLAEWVLGNIEISVKQNGKGVFLDFEGDKYERLSNAVFSFLEKEVERKREERNKNNKVDSLISAFENYGSGPTEKKVEAPKAFTYGVEYKTAKDGTINKRELSKEELLDVLNKSFIALDNDKNSFFTF